MASQSHQATPGSTGNDGIGQARHDPLNLHEYMMSDAKTPRIDTHLQSTPSPSVASAGSPKFPLPEFSKYLADGQRAYPSSFRKNLQMTSPIIASHSFSPLSGQGQILHPGKPFSASSADGVDVDNNGTDSSPPNTTGGLADKAQALGGSKKSSEKSSQQAPWSELRTKAGKERKRLPLACIACRRKKIRCSGEKPACKHCLRSRIPCVYKITTRKAAPRTDYMAMLDKRLKRMEDRVIRLIPKESQPAVPRAVVKPNFPAPPIKATGKKRAASEAFGADGDLEKWAKSRHASKSGESGLPGKDKDLEERGLLIEGADSLPSKEIQQHLAEVYFDFVYGQSYPLLHKPSFLRRLAAGNVAPVLVLAVCAVSARFSNHPEVRTEPAFLRGEDWARAAREIALKRYDTPNITILIVYLLLGLHEFGTCHGGRSWMLAGMAQRMAFALLLHKDLDHHGWGRDKSEQSQLSPTDREIRRRTMWSCFLMDRFNSSGTDRPMQMSEDFVNIPLPIKEQYFQMELSAPTETLAGKVQRPAEPDTGQMEDASQNMGVSAYYIRLVSIWGRLVRYWNLGGREKEKYPIWSPNSQFHSLRDSIQSFPSTLPDSIRWNRENLQNHASEKSANQFVFLHLVHNQLTLFMNRFALPYSGFNRPPKEMPQQFHTDAARSAIEAANQVSLLIKEAIDHNVTAPFAGYCAFYSSTVHIPGVFSKNPRVESVAKQNLAYNVKYLSKMKKYWGMFHFVAENLKELYRQHADASLRGPSATGSKGGQILQYGDWFDRYPHGVSETDYEDPASAARAEPGADAVLGQKSDLQSVEEFFTTLSPPSKAAELRKQAKKAKLKKAAQKSGPDISNTGDTPSPTMPQQMQPHISIQQGLMNPTFNQGYMDNGGLSNFSAADLALLNNTNPLVQPGMLSQLDRHMVLSSYAGMDVNSASAISNTMEHQTSNPSTLANSNHDTFAPSNSANSAQDMWSMDFNAFGMNNGFGGGLTADASTAWFMPFNLDPPDIGGEEAPFSASGMAGPGTFDFGSQSMLGDGMVIDGSTGLGTSSGTHPA
jgi:hypothetical protein